MNNKKFYLGIITVLVLSAVAIYLASNEGGMSSSQKPNSNFAIANTTEIDKIIIKDITNEIVTLTKSDQEWFVNDKFKARPENIDLILKTVQNIKVKSNVPKNAVKNIITNLSGSHKKVDFFIHNKLVKTYFIGNPTPDHLGTYMLLETPSEGKSSVPYIMHLPGFNGFLSSRFFGDESQWKYTGVFNYEIKDIKNIKVVFNEEPTESFQINSENNKLTLLDLKGNTIPNASESLLKSYVVNYHKIHFNQILDYKQATIDSIKAQTPIWQVAVTSNNNKTNKVDFFKKLNTKDETDPVTGEKIKWDPNYALGCFNNTNEIARYQYYTIDKILVKRSFFLP